MLQPGHAAGVKSVSATGPLAFHVSAHVNRLEQPE